MTSQEGSPKQPDDITATRMTSLLLHLSSWPVDGGHSLTQTTWPPHVALVHCCQELRDKNILWNHLAKTRKQKIERFIILGKAKIFLSPPSMWGEAEETTWPNSGDSVVPTDWALGHAGCGGQLGHMTSRRCEAAKSNCGQSLHPWPSDSEGETVSEPDYFFQHFFLLLFFVMLLGHLNVVLCFTAAHHSSLFHQTHFAIFTIERFIVCW